MPDHLRVEPTLDDSIDVWRVWWSARDEWRKTTGAPNVVGPWIRDVSRLMQLANQHWTSNSRALSQATEDAGSEGRW